MLRKRINRVTGICIRAGRTEGQDTIKWQTTPVEALVAKRLFSYCPRGHTVWQVDDNNDGMEENTIPGREDGKREENGSVVQRFMGYT